MQKMYLIFLCNVLLVSTIFGAKVDTTTARKVARSYYLSRINDQMSLQSTQIRELDLKLVHQEFNTSGWFSVEYWPLKEYPRTG